MLVLALDTTSRQGSCAVARDGAVLVEIGGDARLSQATRLPGDLQSVLAQAGLALDSIDVFAVATGPGSFTGLRVGIATMQGLAFAAHRPLIGVSALDALAAMASDGTTSADGRTSPAGGLAPTATWIDAWRGEVYAALYDGTREVQSPTVAAPSALLAGLAGHDTLFIGDGVDAHRDAIVATLGASARFAPVASPLIAGAIARLATDAAAHGARPAPDAIRPLYVRRPDAELARDARTSA